MLYGMYVSAAGAMANSYRLDVVANNLANVDTAGFKKDLAVMQAREPQGGENSSASSLLARLGGGTFSGPHHIDFTPAGLEETARRLDFALAGEGFFQIQKDDQIQYTRDGKFTLDQEGRLVTISEQLPVLDEAGDYIVLDPAALDRTNVSENGLIAQNGAVMAKLGVVDFNDTSVLRKQGDNIYTAGGSASPKTSDAAVKQGFIENSGADPIEQLTNMIKTQRLYQTNLSLLQLQDQTLGMAVARLAKLA